MSIFDSRGLLRKSITKENDRLPTDCCYKLTLLTNNDCLFKRGIVEVLSRQCAKSFTMIEASSKSLLISVRQHTMLDENLIDESCERKKLAHNAYVSSISDVIKAQAESSTEIHCCSECWAVPEVLAVSTDEQQTRLKKMQHQEVKEEIGRRIKAKDVMLQTWASVRWCSHVDCYNANRSLQQLFAVLLHMCQLSDPVSSLEKYKRTFLKTSNTMANLCFMGFTQDSVINL